MTFSLSARDPETGAFGIVVSSSSPAVAARCAHLRAGVGAASSQNVTNPALGTLVLDCLAGGACASEAVRAAVASDPHARFRQLAVVDSAGRTAGYSGEGALGIHAVVEGDAAIAAGNLLSSTDVVQAMLDGYLGSTAESFEGRLLDGYRAALAAGGEAGPVRSAGLAVVETAAWRTTDLRVDDHDDPAGELGRLLALWLPQKADYLHRAVDPALAPSYGVPGDL